MDKEQIRSLSDAELQDKLVYMDRQKAEIKAFYETFDLLLEEASDRISGNLDRFHFQDSEGVVYQLAKWPGQFVQPKEYVLNRTRREGEKAGTLSMVAARELGYEVEGKVAKERSVVPESETAGHPEGK